MNRIKLFLLDLNSEIDFASIGRKLLFTAGLIFFLTSILNIAGMLYETRAPKGVIYAKDNDAGRGVQTATLTRWWNSNHFAPYGNFYFRIAHSIAMATPSDTPKELNEEERNEIIHHFALMVTSLLFFSALCLFLAFQITNQWTTSLWVAPVLLRLGSYDHTWVEFLFRAHPDHMLMFFCAISGYFTLRYTNSKIRRDFILAALFWGLTTAVKRSTVLFIPSFLFLFLADGINLQSIRRGFQFIGYMLLAYLVIGFPQNFGFYKHIWFMYIETFNSLPATKESIFEYLELILKQSAFIWIAILFCHVVAGKKANIINWKFSVFCLISLIVVLAGRMSTNHNHHIMPHVALYFILVIALVKNLPVLKISRSSYILIAASLAALLFLPSSSALEKRKSLQLDCRNEIIELIKIVESHQKLSHRLIRDPYFPFSARYKDLTKQIWGINGEILDKENAGIWGTQKYHLRLLSEKPYRPHIYPDLTLDQWNAKVALATLAQTESSFKTPAGKLFEKIHEDRCGYQVWKRKD